MTKWTTTCNGQELYSGPDETTAKFAYETAIRALESAGFEAWDEGTELGDKDGTVRTDIESREYTSMKNNHIDELGNNDCDYAHVMIDQYLQ